MLKNARLDIVMIYKLFNYRMKYNILHTKFYSFSINTPNWVRRMLSMLIEREYSKFISALNMAIFVPDSAGWLTLYL